MKKYIYAVGLHKDGGLNILNKFIKIGNNNYNFLLDKRLKNKINVKDCKYINHNIIFRLLHLIIFRLKIKKDDHIIFLNGLPPYLKFNCKTSVIFQNANLFKDFYQMGFFSWLFSKDFLRYLNFQLGKKNVDNWYVFSPISKKIIEKHIKIYSNLKIINIFKPVENIENLNHYPNNAQKAEFDFIYPASLMNHKNHKLLINALIKLSNKKIFPKVVLTLEKKDEKKLNIEKLNLKYNINLINFYEPNQEKFMYIYNKCKALLYVSSNETIGLPIIEAHKYNLFIIAPDVDYSTQFIKPHITFKLNSLDDLCSKLENCIKTNFKRNGLNNTINKNIQTIDLNDLMNEIL